MLNFVLRIGLHLLTATRLGFCYIQHMNYLLLTTTAIKITDSLLSKFVLLAFSVYMCTYTKRGNE